MFDEDTGFLICWSRVRISHDPPEYRRYSHGNCSAFFVYRFSHRACSGLEPQSRVCWSGRWNKIAAWRV